VNESEEKENAAKTPKGSKGQGGGGSRKETGAQKTDRTGQKGNIPKGGQTKKHVGGEGKFE